MNLIVKSLAKEYSGRTILENISFSIVRGEKVGLIGENGNGKTTLLRIIAGLEKPDEGAVSFLPSGSTAGFVPQVADNVDPNLSVSQFLKRQNVTAQDISRALLKLGILQLAEKNFSELSSGQKTKIYLARLILQQPDFLLLDEPTNHLDLEALDWLEKYLKELSLGVLLVSHDRRFLDNIVNKIFELKGGNIKIYGTNYTGYKQLKKVAEQANLRNYVVQQKRVKQVVRRVTDIKNSVQNLEKRTTGTDHYQRRKAAKAARGALSMIKRLEKEIIESPVVKPEPDFELSILFRPKKESSKTVVYLKDVSKAFTETTVVKNFSLLVQSGQRVVLRGPNGSGKTTILKMIVGELTPDSGTIEIGNNVEIGYLQQEARNPCPAGRRAKSEILNSGGQSLIEQLTETVGHNRTNAYKLGKKFLFDEGDFRTPVKDLSSGQKSKLALAKILASGANFIILDEPTNHLDIPSREALEEAIASYPGTLLVVSHDRYFLEAIKPDKIILL